jgi:hypothetical protein
MLPARRPYPDELCSSAVFRCSVQFRVPIKRLGRVVLGRQGWHPSFLGATPLRELAELFRLEPLKLLWEHTAFPFATACMGRESFDNAMRNAIEGGGTQCIGLGAVIQNASTGLPFRRLCPGCFEEDLKRHGEPYWHRSHQLPGVWVCLRHECFLHETDAMVAGSRTDLRLPHQTTAKPLGLEPVPIALMRVARMAVAWLERPVGPGESFTPIFYRRMAVDNGWISVGRPVSATRLYGRLTAALPREFLEQTQLQPQRDSCHWLALMIRPGVDAPFAPIKHAVAQVLFGTRRLPDQEPLQYVPAGPPKSSAALIDTFYAQQA